VKIIPKNKKNISSDKVTQVADATSRGVGPTKMIGETAPYEHPSFVGDISQLFKFRITVLLVLCASIGTMLAERKSGLPYFTSTLAFVLFGIFLTASGAAAINELMEIEADGRMSRTRWRPLPAGRMSIPFAAAAASLTTLAGTAILMSLTNVLTGMLTLSTVLFYGFCYTPLKKITPWCTFIGAIPGAMPPLLGWTAIRGRLEPEAFALFAIQFCWQFPHFHAISWLYREDYERAHIKMLPVVDLTGKRTLFQILSYGVLLIPVSIMPYLLRMGGVIYVTGAVILGLLYLTFGIRLAMLKLPPMAAHSKRQARQLLQASVIYLPLLFGLLAANGAH